MSGPKRRATRKHVVLVPPVQNVECGRGGGGVAAIADPHQRCVAARIPAAVPGDGRSPWGSVVMVALRIAWNNRTSRARHHACFETGRDKPVPYTAASARDIVGATLVVARVEVLHAPGNGTCRTLVVARPGTMHEFESGRDKPVPYRRHRVSSHGRRARLGTPTSSAPRRLPSRSGCPLAEPLAEPAEWVSLAEPAAADRRRGAEAGTPRGTWRPTHRQQP